MSERGSRRNLSETDRGSRRNLSESRNGGREGREPREPRPPIPPHRATSHQELAYRSNAAGNKSRMDKGTPSSASYHHTKESRHDNTRPPPLGFATAPAGGLDGMYMSGDVAELLEVKGFQKEAFQSLYEMQQTGELCDVELIGRMGTTTTTTNGNSSADLSPPPTPGRAIPVHRAVLAASSHYFRAMFTADMRERSQHVIDLPDIGHSALEALITFCYTGCVFVTVDNVQPLLFAASLLQVEAVIDLCGAFLRKHVRPVHAFSLHAFAEQHANTELIRLADALMVDNFRELCDEEEFLNISAGHLESLLSKQGLNVESEEEAFNALLRWVKHVPSKRTQHLPKLLKRIKLPLLSPGFLMQEVESEECIRRDWDSRDLLDEAKYHQMALAGLTGAVRLSERIVPRRSYAGVVFCVGGRGSSSPFKSVECYDMRKDKWFEVIEMSTPRRHVGTVATGGKLYTIGGHDGREHLSSGEVFDPITNSWSPISAMSVSRRGLAVAALGGALYAVGGLNDHSCFSLVERYDPVANEWSKLCHMMTSRGGVGLAVVKNCLYAIGGNDGMSSLNTCEKYNPILNKWVNIAKMNKRRAGAGVTVLYGLIYALGGFDDDAPLESAERYDPETNEWTYVHTMTCPRGGVGAAALGGKVYAVGGHDGSNYLNTCEMYNPFKDNWRLVSSVVTCRAGAGVAFADILVKHISEAQTEDRGHSNHKPPPSLPQGTPQQKRSVSPPMPATTTYSSSRKGSNNSDSYVVA